MDVLTRLRRLSAGFAGVVLVMTSYSCSRPLKPKRPRNIGELEYEIRDADTGERIPGRITLVPRGRTRRPKLSSADIGERSGGAVVVYNRVLSSNGRGRVQVPHGRYDVYASRGPEWTIHVVRDVAIGADGGSLAAELRHVVDTPGWITADFHVHAAPSWDSNVPMEYRVIEFMAESVEIIVGTDHNVITDYGPVIEDLDAEQHIASVPGDEITTLSWGHFGAFPLPPKAARQSFGAAWRRSGGKRIFKRIRDAFPNAVIQLNHPAGHSKRGYFREHGYRPRTDQFAVKGMSFDFDAIEVFNGLDAPRRDEIDGSIRDWTQLLLHGHRVTATGNSDTHQLSSLAGYPRNYLRVPDDRPSVTSATAVAQAVRSGTVVVSTAPFIDLRVEQAQVGDTVAAPSGKLDVQLRIQAAPWVSLSRAQVLVDGKTQGSWKIDPKNKDVQRLEEAHTLTVSKDAIVVARVDGDEPMWPIVGRPGSFAVYPFAMTNPIFIDVDGNGTYDAPLPHGHR